MRTNPHDDNILKVFRRVRRALKRLHHLAKKTEPEQARRLYHELRGFVDMLTLSYKAELKSHKKGG